jgi:hypothetical protein
MNILVLLFLSVGFNTIGFRLTRIYCVWGQGVRFDDVLLKLHLEGTRAKDTSVVGEWEQKRKYLIIPFVLIYMPISD